MGCVFLFILGHGDGLLCDRGTCAQKLIGQLIRYRKILQGVCEGEIDRKRLNSPQWLPKSGIFSIPTDARRGQNSPGGTPYYLLKNMILEGLIYSINIGLFKKLHSDLAANHSPKYKGETRPFRAYPAKNRGAFPAPEGLCRMHPAGSVNRYFFVYTNPAFPCWHLRI